MGKLTKAEINRLEPAAPGTEYIRWDSGSGAVAGFGVRVTGPSTKHPEGAKSYLLKYRVGRGRGAPIRKPTLGKVTGAPGELERARDRARKMADEGRDGTDHTAERQREAAERQEREANNVEAVVARFLKRHVHKHNRPSTAEVVERTFRAEVLPKWGSRPIADISRRDVLALLDGIMDRGAAYQANRTLAHVRKLFNWCVERDILKTNPAAGVSAPGKEQSRDRVLEDEELRALWGAFGGLGFPFGPIFRLLMVTGQRRGEVGAMRWADVDTARKLWTLPADATKAGRVHEVPLSDMAVEIIAAQSRQAGPYVFGITGERPAAGFSHAKARAEKLAAEAAEKSRAEGREAVDVADWRLHDLRRTAASGIARLGVAPHILSRVLNHAPGASLGVTAIYNRHGYEAEKRHALDLWARHLRELIEGKADKVVPLRRAR